MNEIAGYYLHKLVAELDDAADRVLRAQLNVSYRRAIFLAVLSDRGVTTQHELAKSLGYSDAAVSLMVRELVKAKFVSVKPSPKHGLKRLISLTPEGRRVVRRGKLLINSQFKQLMRVAGVEELSYEDATIQLLAALRKEQAAPREKP